MRTLDDITGEIIDASIRLHMDLGPGLLEIVYEAVLAKVLRDMEIVDIPFLVGANCVRPAGITDDSWFYC